MNIYKMMFYPLKREIGKPAAVTSSWYWGKSEVGSQSRWAATWGESEVAAVGQSWWTWAGTLERGETAAQQSLMLAVGTWEARRRQSLTIGT